MSDLIIDHHSNTGDNITVFGSPYHKTKNQLIDDYNSSDLEKFLSNEAINSCGSYILIDSRQQSYKLVTSPGFSGGYVDISVPRVTNGLGTLLSRKETIQLDRVGTALYFYNDGKAPYSAIRRTPFNDIEKLKGGMHLEFSSNGIEHWKTYLHYAQETESSFTTAVETVAKALDGKKVTVLFSGGKDSTALYLALRQQLGTENVIPVAIEIEPSGSVRYNNIISIADSLNMDLKWERYPSGWPPTDSEFVEHITERMRSDIVALNPHHGLSPENTADVVVSGQNFDSSLCCNMPAYPQLEPLELIISQINDRDYSSAGKVAFMYLHRNLIPNVNHSQPYLSSSRFRQIYSGIVPKHSEFLELSSKSFHSIGQISDSNFPLYVSKVLERSNAVISEFSKPGATIDSSQEGILMSMFAGKLNSCIIEDEFVSKDIIHTELDYARNWYLDHVSMADEPTYFRFYHYSSNAAEVVSVPSYSGAGQTLVANWGPFVPLSLSPLCPKDIVSPKYELRDYIEGQTGKTYTELVDDGSGGVFNDVTDQPNFPILERCSDRLEPENSTVLSMVPDERLRNSIRSVSADIYAQVDSSDALQDLGSKRKIGQRIINLDLLLTDSL